MIWPTVPSCHGEQGSKWSQPLWRDPDPDREPNGVAYRTCYYCGCMHPEDLLRVVSEGATIHGSDWKYGWPHKFYIEKIRNPLAGKSVKIGNRSYVDKDGNRIEEPMMGTASEFTTATWYNVHIMDEMDDEAREALLNVLSMSGITFYMDEGQLAYSSPGHGYQR